MESEISYNWLVKDALTRYHERDAFVLGNRRVTYAEAWALVERFVAVFKASGLGRGEGVAILSPNTPELWLAQVATYIAGGRFTGLSTLGSLEDHVYVCDDAEICILVMAESYGELGREVMDKAKTVKKLLSILPGVGIQFDGIDPLEDQPSSAESAGGQVAWLQYTGGSTGRPKGVMLTQRGLVHQTLSHLASWAIPEEPRYLAAASITHGSGLPVLPILLRGGTVVLMSAFDPEHWLRTVEEEQINYAFVVPTMLYALLDQASLDRFDLSSLQTVSYGAAPTSPVRILEAIDRIGPVFQQVYGQTEVAGVGTTLRRDDHDPRSPERLASCGRSVVGAEVAVLAESTDPVPDGDVGELCIRTRAAMRGYRNLPAETAEVMRDGWVRTGDMARRDDDGFIYLVDRKKDMIISGGFNIFSREVEAVLEQHSGVESVAVIGVPDEKWGEAVCAVVVRKPGTTASEAELTEHVRIRKGGMYVPKSIIFEEVLPTTALGKIDKKILREPYWGKQTREIH